MSTALELAQGLARRADTIGGLSCYAYMHPNPPVPAFCVSGPIRWTYDETMDGFWRPVFECWVLVNPADLGRAHQAIFAYLAPTGPKSIPAAIYGDPTLGGAASDTRVLGGSRPPGQLSSDSGPLLGCAVEVEVTAA